MILAIDTSGATASVAIYEDQVLAELTWHSGRKHSAQLLPAIEQALALAQVDKQSLSAIGVAIGPGSYSGLRVGVSTAMAMALALDRPVAQVPTLDVITWSQACPHQSSATTARGMLVRAAIDVGRGTVGCLQRFLLQRSGATLDREGPAIGRQSGFIAKVGERATEGQHGAIGGRTAQRGYPMVPGPQRRHRQRRERGDAAFPLD